jgi:hypothetical protein
MATRVAPVHPGGGRAPAPAPAAAPVRPEPEGRPLLAAQCWKQKPKWKSWEERYVVLRGAALDVYATEAEFRANPLGTRGSSIPDLARFEVAADAAGRHGPGLVLRNPGFKYELSHDAMRHYTIQPLVELYGGCMVVLKVS